MRYYDNTRVSDYRSCPRYAYLRHIRHLSPERTGLALVFGLSWHDAMDVTWKMVNADLYDTDTVVRASMAAFLKTWVEEGMKWPLEMHEEEKLLPRTPSVATEMLYNYIYERGEFIKKCELLAVERPFAVPSRRPSREPAVATPGATKAMNRGRP